MLPDIRSLYLDVATLEPIWKTSGTSNTEVLIKLTRFVSLEILIVLDFEYIHTH